MIERLPFAGIIVGIGAGVAAAGIPYTFPSLFNRTERLQISAEMGIGAGSLVFGVAAGGESFINALDLAEKGQTKRAYLEALKGAFYTATALAISGASFGAIAGGNRMLLCAGAGALIGGVFLGVSLYQIHKTRRNVVHFKSSAPPIM